VKCSIIAPNIGHAGTCFPQLTQKFWRGTSSAPEKERGSFKWHQESLNYLDIYGFQTEGCAAFFNNLLS
jgi:hypothetical protein